MRLNGRREIMGYLGIRHFGTWYRLVKLGLPVHTLPTGRVFALTGGIDWFKTERYQPTLRTIYGHDERGHFVSKQQARLQDARK